MALRQNRRSPVFVAIVATMRALGLAQDAQAQNKDDTPPAPRPGACGKLWKGYFDKSSPKAERWTLEWSPKSYLGDGRCEFNSVQRAEFPGGATVDGVATRTIRGESVTGDLTYPGRRESCNLLNGRLRQDGSVEGTYTCQDPDKSAGRWTARLITP